MRRTLHAGSFTFGRWKKDASDADGIGPVLRVQRTFSELYFSAANFCRAFSLANEMSRNCAARPARR